MQILHYTIAYIWFFLVTYVFFILTHVSTFWLFNVFVFQCLHLGFIIICVIAKVEGELPIYWKCGCNWWRYTWYDTNVANSLSNVRMQCVKGATCNYINSTYILETTQPWFDSLRKKRSYFNHQIFNYMFSTTFWLHNYIQFSKIPCWWLYLPNKLSFD